MFSTAKEINLSESKNDKDFESESEAETDFESETEAETDFESDCSLYSDNDCFSQVSV